jgi:hypothetical protein
MNKRSQKRTKYTYRVSNYIKSHSVSLGVFLASYGVFYLSSVLLSLWTIADWGKDITGYPPFIINTLMPRSFIAPIFFVTSFPALVIGAIILCNYSLRGIHPKASADKLYVAILLTAFGFTYQVIGAWPLGQMNVFPWQWQKQIVEMGTVFAWTLYLLSLVVLLIGAFSLYNHSRIYNQKNSDEKEQNGSTEVLQITALQLQYLRLKSWQKCCSTQRNTSVSKAL